MAEVEFFTSVGGDGSKISDDSNKLTGMGAGGHRVRLIKLAQQLVAIAAFVVAKAQEAAAAALTALNAPGTVASSVTPQTWTGASVGADFTWNIQAGKTIVPGMDFKAARTSAVAAQALYGAVKSYNSTSGVIVMTITSVVGTGTAVADWSLSLTQSAGIPTSRSVVGGGLAAGGGDFSADRTITVTKSTPAQIAAATSDSTATTPKGQMDALAPQVLGDAATINLNMALALSAMVTITATRTLGKPTNYHRGQIYDVEVWNTGAFGLNFHACYEGGANGLPVITAGSGKMTLLTMRCIDADATNPRFRLGANLDAP